jgi:DNA-binding XRE family transcriptional regulator
MKKLIKIKNPIELSTRPAKGYTPAYILIFPAYSKVVPLSMKQFKLLKKNYKGPDIYKKTGAYIRELRIQAGLSVKELADKAGIKPSFVSNIENGAKQFSLQSLSGIAKALKHEVESLLKPDTRPDNLTDEELFSGYAPRVWKLLFVKVK